MNKILTIAENTFKEAIRDKILLSITIIGFLLIAASKIFIPISIGEEVKIIKDFGISLIEIFGFFIIVFVGTRIFHQETERKTIYSIMSKPVSALEFVAGKFLGMYYLIVVVLLLLFAIFMLFSGLYLGRIDLYLLNILYFFLFEFLLLDALVIFLSCFMAPLTSGIIALLLFFIAHLTFYLITLTQLIKIPALAILLNFLYYVLPNFSVFNIKASVVYHLPIGINTYMLAFSYSLLYSLILIIFSSFLFSNKEFL
ncbi:MAG: ABC transporter permease [candidate division WOR-3 bacterium]|jgi:ABC-type transport system involved in multi-copper enzyme maturation permease subunit